MGSHDKCTLKKNLVSPSSSSSKSNSFAILYPAYWYSLHYLEIHLISHTHSLSFLLECWAHLCVAPLYLNRLTGYTLTIVFVAFITHVCSCLMIFSPELPTSKKQEKLTHSCLWNVKYIKIRQDIKYYLSKWIIKPDSEVRFE